MTSLTTRERRMIAIGLLVVLAAWVIFGMILPFVSGFFERHRERESLLSQYARNERLIAGVSTWRKQWDGLRKDSDRFALAAPNKTAASDLLRDRLMQLIAATGGELKSFRDVDADAGWVQSAIDMRIALPNLTLFLQQIQSSVPYMIVRSFAVDATQSQLSGQPKALEVRLEIAAPYPIAAPR